MSRLGRFALVVVTLSLGACGGNSSLTDPGAGTDDGTKMECFGDPDSGGVICKPVSELWDCTSMPNGDVKCAKKDFSPPGGGGTWSCTVVEGKVTCTSTNAGTDTGGTGTGGTGTGTGGTGASSGGTGTSTGGTDTAPGGGLWSCTQAGDTTTCVYEGSSAPPGGGSWSCTASSEFGLVCVGSGTGSSGGDTSTGGTGTGDTSSGGTGTGGTGTGDTGTGDTGTGDTGTGGTGTGDTGTGGTGSWSGFACSYAMFVFTYQGQTYVMKIDGGAISCHGENSTSKDDTFSTTCNGQSYDNHDFIMNQDGAAVTPYGGSCPALFDVSRSGVTAITPGVTILFGVAHNGTFPNHFAELCPAPGGTTQIDFPPICGGQ